MFQDKHRVILLRIMHTFSKLVNYISLTDLG